MIYIDEETKTGYFHGHRVLLTGKTETVHGSRIHEFEYTEFPNMGRLGWNTITLTNKMESDSLREENNE